MLDQVGRNETSSLHVHTAILTRSSKFLQNAMKPEWRTDATKPIDMSDVNLTIFEGYCAWLYTGNVLYHGKYQRYLYLACLYVVGERLMDTAFQDVIGAAFISRQKHINNRFPGNTMIQTNYASTFENSPARRLMVDFWVFGAKSIWIGLTDLIENICPDLVNDLVRGLIAKRGAPDGFVQRLWLANPESYRVGSKETK